MVHRAVSSLAVLKRVVSCSLSHPVDYIRIELALSDALDADAAVEMARELCDPDGTFTCGRKKNHLGQNCLVLSRRAKS